MDDTLKTLVAHIEERRDAYVDRLREAVEIRSVSGWPDHRDDVIKMVKWTAQHLGCIFLALCFPFPHLILSSFLHLSSTFPSFPSHLPLIFPLIFPLFSP